jgi:hypothetical protein
MHCHNDFHAQTGMAGVLVVSPDYSQSAWSKSRAGNKIFKQCRLATQNTKKGFDDWKAACCYTELPRLVEVCPPPEPLARDTNYWSSQP